MLVEGELKDDLQSAYAVVHRMCALVLAPHIVLASFFLRQLRDATFPWDFWTAMANENVLPNVRPK